MKLIGKIIKIYVRGTTSRSLRSIEIVNWSGKAFLGNRSHLKQLKEIQELSETGIYFLLNNNEDSGLTEIYIGETDTVSKRLNQHTAKDWWDTFVVFISRDLTKAHVKYLESKLHTLALDSVATLKVMNDGIPSGAKLPEPEECAMEEFASNMIFTLETLGLGLFQSNSNEDIYEVEKSSNRIFNSKNYEAADGMEFYITLPKDISQTNDYLKAYMSVRNGVFVLKAGSPIKKECVDSFQEHTYYELWQQIINSNSVIQSDNSKIFITTRDLEFKSPSAAGAIVRARATNGRNDWKRISDNKSFYECESEEAA